jgi:hypothetical protein
MSRLLQLLALLVFALSGLVGLTFTPLGIPALGAAVYLGITVAPLRRLLLGGVGATRWWSIMEAGLLIGVLWVIWQFVLFPTSDQVWLALVPLGMVGLAGIGFALASLPRAGRLRDGLAAGAALMALYPGLLILAGLAYLAVAADSEDMDGRALRARMQVIFSLLAMVTLLSVAAWREQRRRG